MTRINSKSDVSDELTTQDVSGVLAEAITSFQNLQMKFVRRQYIEDTFSISRSTIYRLMAIDAFPSPVSIPGVGVRWVLSELMEWAQDKANERDSS